MSAGRDGRDREPPHLHSVDAHVCFISRDGVCGTSVSTMWVKSGNGSHRLRFYSSGSVFGEKLVLREIYAQLRPMECVSTVMSLFNSKLFALYTLRFKAKTIN